mgnify:CR=1 FL=1
MYCHLKGFRYSTHLYSKETLGRKWFKMGCNSLPKSILFFTQYWIRIRNEAICWRGHTIWKKYCLINKNVLWFLIFWPKKPILKQPRPVLKKCRAWFSMGAEGAWHPPNFWISPLAPAYFEVLNTNWHPQSSFYATNGTLNLKFLTQVLKWLRN